MGFKIKTSLFFLMIFFTLGKDAFGLQTQLTVNRRPIIGIVAQEVYDDETGKVTDQSYIAASYVKFVEGAGAQAVPIFVNRSVSYVREIFQKINGVLIPGGSVYFPDSDKRGGYSFVARELLRLAAAANERNDYFPIWGTCLGFELMVYHEANGADVMTSCSAWNVPMKLKFTESAVSSRLFNPAPKAVVKLLATEKLTANFHRSCVTPQNFTSFRIDQGYKMLSRNFDQEAKVTFISTIEHRKYPFYGTQFHPEKNLYEWTEKEDIPHGFEASQVAQYFANFFVQEARKNGHKFSSVEEENAVLIYNYLPTFTGRNGSTFNQKYFF